MFKFYESARTKSAGRTSANLYLQLKWDLTDYENHRLNIKKVASRLDNDAPRTFSHMYYRPKTLQLELERFAKIQRANKSLMRRIATIQRDGGWTQNKNFYEIKSLNTWKRQQEMTGLCYENQVMITRLMDVRAVHNTHKLEEEYLEFKKHKMNVQRYPKDWRLGVRAMKIMQKHIRAMVKARRTGKYKPEMKERLEYLALKKEATEELRREKEEEAKKEAEEQRRIKHEAEVQQAKERKQKEEERKTQTKEWRDARADRLQRIEKKKEDQEKQLQEEKKRQDEARKKRTNVAKEKVQQWKTLQEEEEKQEIEKKRSEEVKKKMEEQSKAKAAQEKRKKKLAQWKDRKTGKVTSGSSVESVVFSMLDFLENQEGYRQEDDSASERTVDIPGGPPGDIPEELAQEDMPKGYDWETTTEEGDTEDGRLSSEGGTDEPAAESDGESR